MPHTNKPKPLAHFPSAMAQETNPADMRQRDGVIKRLFRIIVMFSILAAIFTAGLVYFLSRGPVSNERLRVEIASALSAVLGPTLTAEVNDARISFGEGGILSVSADKVKIIKSGDKGQYGDAEEIHIGVKLLPLLRGEFKVKTIFIEKSEIDLRQIGLTGRNWDGDWPDAFQLEKIMRVPAERLFYLSQSMGFAGLEKVTWRNLRIKGLGLSEQRSKDIVVRDMVVRVQDKTGKLSIDAVAQFGLREVRLNGNWEKSNGSFALNLKVDGLDANDFLENAVSSTKGAVALNAPLKLTYHHPYDQNMNSGQSTLKIDVSRGLARFGHEDIVAFSGGQFNLRLLPGKNQIELEKSPVYFSNSGAVLTGGIRFPLSSMPLSTTRSSGSSIDAANLRKPIFEFIANDIVANPGDAPGQAVNATFKVAGKLDPVNKVLEMEEISLWSPEGNIRGAGSFGFAGETPSLAMALTIPRMSIETVKQIWPVFIATKARRWVIDHVSNGEISNARIDAAVPAGILGKVREGKKFTPEQMSIQLDVSGTTIKTIGDMPAISQANGAVLFQGMKTRIDLTAGLIEMENGRTVDATNGVITIGDFQDKPARASLKLNLKGKASDLLKIGSKKPLNLVKTIKIRPNEVSGDAKIGLDLKFPLLKDLNVSNVEWSAIMKLNDVTLAKPLQGRKLSKANVSIFAKPGIATIKGKVSIDGVPSTIDMTQPFGENQNGKARQIVKLTLDRKARKKLGIDLDTVLKGKITVLLTATGEKGVSKVSVDLTRSVISLPWISWSKGSGIKGKSEFTMRTSNKGTRITDFKLFGAGFSVAGNIDLDKRGVKKANFSKLTLNKGDNLRIAVNRTKTGYSITANGSAFDARAVINQIIKQGAPKANLSKSGYISLKANISRVRGFGDVVLSDVAINYSQKNGRLAHASMIGNTNVNLKTTMSIIPKNGITTTKLVSANAGQALRFLNIYSRMSGGRLQATFRQKGNGPHKGKVMVAKFRLKNEPRLKRLLSQKASNAKKQSRDQPNEKVKPKIDPNDVKINVATADVIKNINSLVIRNGLLRAADVGSNFAGTVYNAEGVMDLRGTYLPGYGLNKFASKIPIVNLAFGDGTKRGFLGITYRLRGKARNPIITVNPISVIAPGVFRKIFEFRN